MLVWAKLVAFFFKGGGLCGIERLATQATRKKKKKTEKKANGVILSLRWEKKDQQVQTFSFFFFKDEFFFFFMPTVDFSYVCCPGNVEFATCGNTPVCLGIGEQQQVFATPF